MENHLYKKIKKIADIIRQDFRTLEERIEVIFSLIFLKYLSYYRKEQENIISISNTSETDKLDKIDTLNERIKLVNADTNTEYFWDNLVENNDNSNFSLRIETFCKEIAKLNPKFLKGIWENISFSNTINLDERNQTLLTVCAEINTIDFSKNENKDVLGEAYEQTIGNLYNDLSVTGARQSGQYFTPHGVAKLIAKIIDAKNNSTIYDPTCGSGTLLLITRKEVQFDKTVQIFGQEIQQIPYTLAKINMILHNIWTPNIMYGDTLANPLNIIQNQDNKKIKKFDYIVANPPFGTAITSQYDTIINDKYNRFKYGMITKKAKKAELLLLQHMIASCKDDGKIVTVMASGFTFREQVDKQIRIKLISEGIIESLIFLPRNIFQNAGANSLLVIIDKAKKNKDIFFINAEKYSEKRKKINIINKENIEKIVKIYKDKKDIVGISKLVKYNDLIKNNYSLIFKKYVDEVDNTQKIDLKEHRAKFKEILNKIISKKQEIDDMFSELVETKEDNEII